MERLRDVMCFKSYNSVFDGSWRGSVDAFKTISMEDCRKLGIKYLSDVVVYGQNPGDNTDDKFKKNEEYVNTLIFIVINITHIEEER